MNAVMGRDIPMAFPLIILSHFGIALVYMFVMASVIYRFKTPVAVPIGIGIAIGLYFANFLLSRAFGITMQSPEFRPFLVHFMFGLFGSLLYKAMSVPKPLPT
ncbi:hypothetical protein ACXR0O_22470 [Verrucomicrobiota bacterium sgz303538]